MKKTLTLMALALMATLASFAQGKVSQMTTEEFQKNIFDFMNKREWSYDGKRPCVIDFYATWCGPCKMLAPRLEALAKEYDGQVDFYKVDTDKEPTLAQVFGIQSIPTLLFVPTGGAQPQFSQGALQTDMLKQIIDVNLLGKKPVTIEFIQPGE